MYLSVGYKKEFLILNFSIALLTIVVDKIDVRDTIILNDNKNHKLNKRIYGRISDLLKELRSYSQTIYSAQENNDLVEWMRKKNRMKILNVLTKVDHDKVSLEYLALWMLFINFSPNERNFIKLDSSFDKVVEKLDFIMDTIYLLDDTTASLSEQRMADLAREYIQQIKN